MTDGRCVPGCEVLLRDPPAWMRSARIGLLANQSSVTPALQDLTIALMAAGVRPACIFSPQHGYFSDKQANMVESDDSTESQSRIPIYSLYGRIRQPTAEMLNRIDILVVDLQDVGTRVYTYATTLGLCMEMASTTGTKVVVLDRPNPIGGAHCEGNLLQDEQKSFVGRYRLPMRHGLTMGELARYVAARHGIDCDLEIVPVKGWRRSQLFDETGLHWVFPSPNMPTWETALLYPGMVLFEGTNVSEGRGTTLPFQLLGAPFVNPSAVLARLSAEDLGGTILRPVSFEPTFDKWQGETCHGFQIHITDPDRLRPYRLGLALIQAIGSRHGDVFRWHPPPYEYEYEQLPIDILIGDRRVRERLAEAESLDQIESDWQADLQEYLEERENVLLYG